MTNIDPVYKGKGKSNYWYFWNETGSETIGPFKSEENAREALTRYSKYLTTGDRNDYPDDLIVSNWRHIPFVTFP